MLYASKHLKLPREVVAWSEGLLAGRYFHTSRANSNLPTPVVIRSLMFLLQYRPISNDNRVELWQMPRSPVRKCLSGDLLALLFAAFYLSLLSQKCYLVS